MIRRTNLTTWLIISVFLAGFAPAVAAGGTIYVDAGASGSNNGTSWANAYKYLQDALADANVSGDIWVAAGTYYPDANTAVPVGSGDRMAMFQLINGVVIYGGFPSGGGEWSERDPNAYETILSGDLMQNDGPDFANNDDNSYHVVTGSYTEPNAVLDGFTVTAGNANGGGLNNYGGGMWNSSGSPTVTSCTFSGNSATITGGGMFNDLCSPTVINCIFSGNSAANGGGMYSHWYSYPTLTNCTFTGNLAGQFGGGMHNYEYSSPTVTNCTFSGNIADANGGGMYNNLNSSPTVTNCTFSGNSASGGDGGGMYNYDSDPNITNCILWGNTDSGPTDESAQIYNSGSTPDVNYCCIQDWSSGGTGNISTDPVFKDADGVDDIIGTEDDDLSLSFNSPCIDAGDNNSVPADTADLDEDGDTGERTPLDLAGNARFTDDPYVVDTGKIATAYPDIVEMGAYERYEFCGDADRPFPDGDISGPDGIPDCRVDFFDFAVVAAHWLEDVQPE